jgi:23S rRNA pseudouridine1911/1915/1917 synthase
LKNKTRQLVLTITPDLAKQRIDKALASIPDIATRSQAAKLIELGSVRNAKGQIVKPSEQTVEGSLYHIDVPVIQTDKLIPYDFKLDIIFEDSDVIVVNKPAGLVVHPAAGHEQDTLVNALLHHTDDLSMGFNEKRPGLVHRIDKGTSGLLVIAKHDEAQRKLSLQFHEKTIHRLYRAVAFGSFHTATGTIRSSIARHPEDRKRMASIKEAADESSGKKAITHFRVLQTHQSGLTLVELRLETGRTHQIRVHLSEMAHPIVGDAIYGGIHRAKSLKSMVLRRHIEAMPRFALHAAELGFLHPTTNKFLKFTAPWPDDLKSLIDFCGFQTEFEQSPLL